MFSEQMLMNAGVLIVAAKAGGGDLTTGIVGFVFNVMLIVRAPLQLFQAIQTSILPHLAGLEARESAAEFHRAIRMTVLVIAAFGLAVALGLLVIGPPVMTAVLGDKGLLLRARRAGRWSASGWGCISSPGRSIRPRWPAAGRRSAAVAWLVAAALFVVFVATGGRRPREVTRVEVGYFGATAVLCRAAVAASTAAARHRRLRARRRRRDDPRVGRGRIGGAEHGRAGDQQVGARLDDGAGGLAG